MFNDILPKQSTIPTLPPSTLHPKPNPSSYPLHVHYTAHILLDTSHPNSSQATSFLTAICEPVSRPTHIHEYKITPYSLYAAVCIGLREVDIISSLEAFSKNYVPEGVIEFIRNFALKYGRVVVVARWNRYWLEVCESVRELVLGDDVIKGGITVTYTGEDERVMVEVNNVDRVRRRCIEIDYPAIEEYDFRAIENKKSNESINLAHNDLLTANYFSNTKPDSIPSALPVYNSFRIDLKPHTSIRSYQETCLNKMFSNGRARSGIIVLPCGAGKTLVGITAITTMKQPTLILCTSAVSVVQWKSQLLHYTNINESDISLFTSDRKDDVNNILITTYTMLAYSGKRSSEAQRVMDKIDSRVWGLLILDEVHVVPANMFRRVVTVKHHTKLGLTATLVREDDRIEDLNFLIGPKLYEADWQDLSRQGHIATVECVEVWCAVPGLWYKTYINSTVRHRRVLGVLNPGKLQACDYLIRMHEQRGDKIIVFSDNVYALKTYAIKLNKPYIHGPTSQQERMRILQQFQTNPKINTIFLSKVGDTSIDLPEATCLIQISSHYGSRRQEAQRLGRILRAKRRNDPGFRVYFYSLVSKDTDEMYYSAKRQAFLVDQGYSFRVVQDLKPVSSVFATKGEQRDLLATVMMEEYESDDESDWKDGRLRDVIGGEGVAYIEKKRKVEVEKANPKGSIKSMKASQKKENKR